MNKKADFPVVALVLLTLLTVSVALYSFYSNSNKVKADVLDAKIAEVLDMQEKQIEFYIDKEGKTALAKTYDSFVNEGVIFLEKRNDKFVLGSIDPNWKDRFAVKFKENFQKEFEKYNFEEEDYLWRFKGLVTRGSFSIFVKEDRVEFYTDKFILNEVELKQGSSGEGAEKAVEVKYVPKISKEFIFNRNWINSFKELEEFRECFKNKETNCDLKLFNFNIETSKIGVEDYIKLSSKREFLIDDMYKRIEFGFIVA